LLPYGGSVSGLTVKNAEYELDNAALTPDFPLGVSNEFTGRPVEISFKQGILLIFLSKD
jgi:thiamine pyrophosphokinase